MNTSPAHYAVVVTTSPLTIKTQGSTAAVPALRLSSYTATVGDRVAYVVLDTRSLLVIGKPV